MSGYDHHGTRRRHVNSRHRKLTMVGVPVWTRRTARQRSPDVEAGRIIPRSVDCYNAIKSSDTSPNVLITLALLRSPEQDHLSRPRWRALRQFCVCSQYLRGDRRRVVPGNPGSCDYRDRAGTSRPPRSCSAGRALYVAVSRVWRPAFFPLPRGPSLPPPNPSRQKLAVSPAGRTSILAVSSRAGRCGRNSAPSHRTR